CPFVQLLLDFSGDKLRKVFNVDSVCSVADADAETQGSEVMDQLNSSKEDAGSCKD
uniref:Uncharacterized protein n=1 Tax=Aegilops tauschii subsp. strangulata TaxID=200361 RepID=A0A453LST0_AEGTS